jgi:phosphate transport system permease protein
LKATLYALLFAVPIALLAAIATSEFLHPRVKARVKPAIEMMASLPSVVLGFVGALVLAPIVEDRCPRFSPRCSSFRRRS